MRMQPIFEKISSSRDSSIHTHQAINKYVNIPWHYHPEIEITHIHHGSGTRYVGTNVGRFNPGEVTLIGPNIPHLWVNDKEYYNENSKLEHEDWVIQFKNNFWGSEIVELPEFKKIRMMLTKAPRGVVLNFNENILIDFLNTFEKLLNSKSYHRISLLIELLGMMADNNDWKYLNSNAYYDVNHTDSERMQRVFTFVTDNYKKNISVKHAAELISLSTSGFSRYFKKLNGKSFIEYVTEVRIDNACKMLINGEFQITEVCYESGFNNFSNFSRHFKNITGFSPLKYRKLHSF